VENNDSIMHLPEIDREYLGSKEYDHEVVKLGSAVHLILRSFELPEAYSPRRADLLLILPAGYPNSSPDMFWTHPDVRLTNGAWPQAAEVHETYGECSWQRWSRHFNGGAWRPGTDDIRTFLAAIRRELAKGI
jgi:hypothetical protein